MTEVQYVRVEDGTHVAYQVLEADPSAVAPHDIVMVSGGLIPLELFEEEPGFARLLDGLRTIGRVVVFDRRGIGLSDPIVEWDRPIVEQWTDDLKAVVDASGVSDAVIVSWESFGVAPRYVATRPAAVTSLVLYEPMIVPDDEWVEWSAERKREVHANMRGEADILESVAPSLLTDKNFRDWYARAGRSGASPASAGRIWESVFSGHPNDLRLSEIDVPTLVMHRKDNAYACDNVLELAAEQMPDANVVEIDGRDHFPFVGDVDAFVAEIADFVVGERRLPPPQRLLAAVMFTDLVGSTRRAAALGDAHWKVLLDRHDATVRGVVGRTGGTVVKTTGDGVLALFPSAGVALLAARRLQATLAADDLEIRVGVHVGDVDRRGDDVSGLAVNIAARVMSVADDGRVAVTVSVVAAVAGQAGTFESMGPHELKGVPGVWELCRVVEEA